LRAGWGALPLCNRLQRPDPFCVFFLYDQQAVEEWTSAPDISEERIFSSRGVHGEGGSRSNQQKQRRETNRTRPRAQFTIEETMTAPQPTRKLHMLPLGRKEEALLLDQLQQGVPEAFEMLYHHFVGRVMGLSMQLLRDPAAAEDAAQETFIRVYRSVHRFRGDSRLSTWIHRIATNVCLTEIERRKRRGIDVEPTQLPDAGGPTPSGTDLRLSLAVLLERLEPRKRAAFYLCHVEGLSAGEVATVLDESRDAVLKRLQRTRRELLALWQEVTAEPTARRRASRGRS